MKVTLFKGLFWCLLFVEEAAANNAIHYLSKIIYSLQKETKSTVNIGR